MEVEAFSTWIQDLTAGSTFSRKGATLPTKEQLQSLLRVKSFHPVLKHMMRHIRPLQERQHIKMNIKNSYFRKHLVEEKNMSDLQRSHSAVKSLIEEAEKQLSSEAQDLKSIVEEERRVASEEKKLRSQIALFNVACREREDSTRNLKKQNEGIIHLLPEGPEVVSPQDESLKQKIAVDDMDMILAKLKSLRLELLHNKKENLHDQKSETWDLVETLLGRYSPLIIDKAFSSIILRDTQLVWNTTQAVDLGADAKALLLKYHSNGLFTDVLNPHGILETVESMMVQMSAKHVQRHFALQKLIQETKLSADSLETISSSLRSDLNEQHDDPSLVAGIMDLFEATIRVGGLKASLSCAASTTRDLEARTEVAKMGRKSLEEKYRKIVEFEETVKTRVSDLKQLVMAISQSLEALREEKKKVITLVKDSVDALVLPTPFMKDSFSTECEKLLNMPFEALTATQSQDVLIPSLSIGPIDDLFSDLSSFSRAIPYVSSWEQVIETVRLKKALLRSSEARQAEELADLEVQLKQLPLDPLSVYAVKALQQKVRTHDQRLEEEILPLLKKFEETNSEAENTVARFKEVMEDWWNQPGEEIRQYLKQT